MKQKKLLALLLVLCMVLSLLPTVAFADEEVFYTLDGTITGGTNSYANASNITQDSMDWVVEGNTTMNPWRIGGMSITNTDRPIYSETAMESAITKVEVEVGTANSITVNSFKLIVASDSDFESVIDTVVATFTANSTITFEPTSGTNWATGAFYKFIFNVTVSGSSNKFVQFKSAKFYKESSDTPTVKHTVTLKAGTGSGEDFTETVNDGASYTLLSPADYSFTAPEGYTFDCWMVEDTEYAIGETIQNIKTDITVTAQWKQLPTGSRTYRLVTSLDQLYAGDTVLLVGGEYYALGNQTSNNRSGYSVTVDSGEIVLNLSEIGETAADAKVHELTLGKEGDNWTFYDPLNPGYLYAASSSSNHLKTQSALDNNGKFSLKIDADSAEVTAVAQGTNTHKIIRFNPNGGKPIFSCYASGQQPIYLYKLMPVVKSHSLVLSDDIGINFFMDLSMLTAAEMADSYMTFEISGKGTTTAQDNFNAYDKDVTTGNYYGFTCYVNSLQMADTVTATFHYGDNKTVTNKYSIKKYIDDTDLSATNKTTALVKALADYGHYAQLFLQDAHSFELGTEAGYARMDTFFTDYGTNADTTLDGAIAEYAIRVPEGKPSPAYALSLDGKTSLRVYFTDGTSFTLDGEACETTTDAKGRNVVTISGLSAHMLSTQHTIRVDNTYDVKISALSYMAALRTADTYKNDANARNAAYAFYKYATAADAYNAD